MCNGCGIDRIENDTFFPRELKELTLCDNNISVGGCRDFATLLQGRGSKLSRLDLDENKICDECVAILVDALRSNTSLTDLGVTGNDDISNKGKKLFIKLVLDISSINATLQSNHTLKVLRFIPLLQLLRGSSPSNDGILSLVNLVLGINKSTEGDPETSGREKVIQAQLHSGRRAMLARLGGHDVSQSVYREIDPHLLPMVLSLVGQRHGQEELYIALKSSIAGVISVVNRRAFIEEKIAYHNAQLEELEAELVTIGKREAQGEYDRSESGSRKRLCT